MQALAYHIISYHVRSFCISLSWLADFDLIYNSIILLTFCLVNILPVFAFKFGTFHLISIHSVLSLSLARFLACLLATFLLASLFLLLFPRYLFLVAFI